ncbi:MAG: arsenic resistance protein, partial [Thermomicrobium sp.]
LDPARGRALVFSTLTRNSLVVLPLALALPREHSLVALVIVTQTLVELTGLLLAVRIVPRLLPARLSSAPQSWRE